MTKELDPLYHALETHVNGKMTAAGQDVKPISLIMPVNEKGESVLHYHVHVEHEILSVKERQNRDRYQFWLWLIGSVVGLVVYFACCTMLALHLRG